jgi:hypothetical protein
MPGQVRWWDGTNWTEHVSKPEVAAVVAADHVNAERTATVTYIGRHAAGETPAPRQPSTAPRIRPRVRDEVQMQVLAYA